MKRQPIQFKSIWFYCPILLFALCAIHWGSEAVTTISQRNLPGRGVCIIVDAGHGGEDGGATSCSGVLESQFNLEIALRLNDLLQFMGYDTKMVRTTDSAVHAEGETIAARKRSDLNNRVRLVNTTENALLISIHQNTFPDGRYSGPQVFFAKGSEQMAKHFQIILNRSLSPKSSRQAKPAKGVYLMEHISAPGILIECGFLSNPQEEAKLRDPSYQQKISCVIVSALCEYLSNT